LVLGILYSSTSQLSYAGIECSPPVLGDWIVSSTCTMVTSDTVDGNLIVPNGVVLTIPNGVTLTITFVNNITIVSGGGILIQSGGTVIVVNNNGSTFIVEVEEGSGVQGCEEFNECYFPYSQEVVVGDTVSWINNDAAAHTVTSGTFPDASGLFDSGLFLSGNTFDFTFNAPGIFPYFCVVHPWAAGEIVVD